MKDLLGTLLFFACLFTPILWFTSYSFQQQQILKISNDSFCQENEFKVKILAIQTSRYGGFAIVEGFKTKDRRSIKFNLGLAIVPNDIWIIDVHPMYGELILSKRDVYEKHLVR